MSGLLEAPDMVDALARAMTGDSSALANPWDSLDPTLDPWTDSEQKKWWDGGFQVSSAAPELARTEAQNPLLKQQAKSALQTGEVSPGEATDIRRWTVRHQNGRIPLDQLEKVGNEYMRPDAAESARAMIRAAKKDGVNLVLVSGYRSYQEQAGLYQELHGKSPVAEAGQSQHGWGMAGDWNVADPNASAWLADHSEKYGFYNDVTGDPEHFDYRAGSATTFTPKKTAFGPRRKQRDAFRGATLNKIDVGSPTRLAWVTNAPSAFVDVYTTPRAKRGQTQKTGFGANLPSFVPKKYRDDITDAARQYGVSARLLSFLIQHESDFKRKAVSSAGALGETQLMPYNAEGINPYNAWQNIHRGASILSANIRKANGDLVTALAAYNAGWGNLSAGYGYAHDILSAMRAA